MPRNNSNKIIINDDETATILDNKGAPILLDAEDLDKVSDYTWYVNKKSKSRRFLYATTEIAGQGIQMQRLIMGLDKFDPITVRHINGDGLDNRKSNLRLSRVGVQERAGRWRARIVVKGNQICLGTFATQQQAANAYDKAALIHFQGTTTRRFCRK